MAPLILNLSEKIAKYISEYVFVRENKIIMKLQDKEECEINRMFLQNPDLFIKHREDILKKKKEEYRKKRADNQKNIRKSNTRVKGEFLIPMTYYKRIRIGDLKLYISFHSKSILMNFNTMKMFTDPIDKYDRMYSPKDFYEKLILSIRNSALTSILKYKCLGVRGKIDDDEKEIKDKDYYMKRKMLLGY